MQLPRCSRRGRHHRSQEPVPRPCRILQGFVNIFRLPRDDRVVTTPACRFESVEMLSRRLDSIRCPSGEVHRIVAVDPVSVQCRLFRRESRSTARAILLAGGRCSASALDSDPECVVVGRCGEADADIARQRAQRPDVRLATAPSSVSGPRGPWTLDTTAPIMCCRFASLSKMPAIRG